jgi:hypothetical protein
MYAGDTGEGISRPFHELERVTYAVFRTGVYTAED